MNIVATALGPTSDCATIEELEAFASGAANARDRWTKHVRNCAYCRSELHLLHRFLAPELGDTTSGASKAAELLRKRSGDVLKKALPRKDSIPWRKSAFFVRRMAWMSVAAAVGLLIVGAAVLFRSTTNQPKLEAENRSRQEVFRSPRFAVFSPSGEVRRRPKEIRWEPVPQASVYQVRLLEVDRREVWKARATGDHIDLPVAIQSRIVPAKTLFVEVTAFDSPGNQVGTTGLVRFRLTTTGN